MDEKVISYKYVKRRYECMQNENKDNPFKVSIFPVEIATGQIVAFDKRTGEGKIKAFGGEAYSFHQKDLQNEPLDEMGVATFVIGEGESSEEKVAKNIEFIISGNENEHIVPGGPAFSQIKQWEHTYGKLYYFTFIQNELVDSGNPDYTHFVIVRTLSESMLKHVTNIYDALTMAILYSSRTPNDVQAKIIYEKLLQS